MTDLFFKRNLARCYKRKYKFLTMWRVYDLLYVFDEPIDNELAGLIGLYGDMRCVKLIQERADLDEFATYKLLGGACRGGHHELIDKLLRGYSFDAEELNICLYEASVGGQMAVAKRMISLGADNLDFGLSGACKGCDVLYGDKDTQARCVELCKYMTEIGAQNCGTCDSTKHPELEM